MIFIDSTIETEEMRELNMYFEKRGSQTTAIAYLAHLLFLWTIMIAQCHIVKDFQMRFLMIGLLLLIVTVRWTRQI